MAIARALAHDPPLILADEPTAHLDYVQCEIVLTLLRELAGGGRTVVIATHDDRLLPLADRVVELTPRFGDGSERSGTVHLAAGEVLFRQGDASDVVYLIEDGDIDVVRELADGASETPGHARTRAGTSASWARCWGSSARRPLGPRRTARCRCAAPRSSGRRSAPWPPPPTPEVRLAVTPRA